MTLDPRRSLDVRLATATDEALDELERALLKARASELTEVRRRQARLITGYGDATTRAVLDDEGRRAQLRYEALTELLDAIRDARANAD